MDGLLILWQDTGLANFQWQQLVMIAVGCLLLYLAIVRQFEPLLLLPIGFGAILANIPNGGFNEPGGLLYYIYEVGIASGVFPLLIFLGVGALTDFGALIANPKTLLLGAAAQFGIFATLLGAVALNELPGFAFTLKEAASIAIIGGADGPTAIFLTSRLAPDLLGAIAVAAYSYMALVPIIQPPIMRALTRVEERKIRMVLLRVVSKREKILFPMLVLGLCVLFLPAASPLIGMFCLGNLFRESGVVERLSHTVQNELTNAKSQKNRDDIDEFILYRMREPLHHTGLTKQIAQTKHTNQGRSGRQKQDTQSEHQHREQDLLPLTHHSELHHADFPFFHSGQRPHDRRLNDGYQRHVRISSDGDRTEQIRSQATG
jgi:Na+-transporting methylmalonyl-CoA/oxaloacetate decarboxylase beta subunit